MNRGIDAAFLLFEEFGKFREALAVRNVQLVETQLFSMVSG